MIAFPGMIADAAEQAGIKVPQDLENYDPQEFPHWTVFCNAQLGTPQPYPGVHWDNAHVIAQIPDSEILKVTLKDLEKRGFCVGYSEP